MTTDYYADLAKYILSHAPAGFARAKLNCQWFDGVIHGPHVAYFDTAGDPVPSKWGMDTGRDLGRLFRPQREAERRLHVTDGALPNVFDLAVHADGSHEASWTYDPEAQARLDADTRAKLGDEEFERLQRPARASAPPPPPPPEPDSDEPLSIPELLGFIREELDRDAPAGWKNLYVEGEVWDEGGISNVRTVYHYTLPDDAQRRQLTASNVVGPMNAVKALQRQMSQEGNTWRKVKLEYEAGTSRTLIDTE